MSQPQKTPAPPLAPVQWITSAGLTPYPLAVSFMERRVGEIAQGLQPECVWLVEHPPLYTAGTSANPRDLIEPDRFSVFQTGRGGQYTYHGPGQRIAYVMLDLNRRGRDVRLFVRQLEHWLIGSLSHFGVVGETRNGRVGVWVQTGSVGLEAREEKIAAIGIRVRRWVSFHGVSINVAPDLSHYSGITPCGIKDHGVTSLDKLGKPASMRELDRVLQAQFQQIFGNITETGPASGTS